MNRLRKALRGIALPASGAAAIALLVVVGLLQPEPPVPDPPRRARTVAPSAERSATDDAVPWGSLSEAVPLDPVSEFQTAVAMDDTGLQYQVSRLRIAALSGEPEVT